jgi:hypothetical protein
LVDRGVIVGKLEIQNKGSGPAVEIAIDTDWGEAVFDGSVLQPD